jgi:hypothetical protein
MERILSWEVNSRTVGQGVPFLQAPDVSLSRSQDTSTGPFVAVISVNGVGSVLGCVAMYSNSGYQCFRGLCPMGYSDAILKFTSRL